MKRTFQLTRSGVFILSCNLIGFGAGVTALLLGGTNPFFVLMTVCAGVATVSKIVSGFHNLS